MSTAQRPPSKRRQNATANQANKESAPAPAPKKTRAKAKPTGKGAASAMSTMTETERAAGRGGGGVASKRAAAATRNDAIDNSYNQFFDVDVDRAWVPPTLREQIHNAPATTLSSAMAAAAVTAGVDADALAHGPHVIDKDELIAQLRGQIAGLQDEGRDAVQARMAAEQAREVAERHAAELQRRTKEARLNEMAKGMAPIPRPSRPRSATWTWTKMEVALGLAPPTSKRDASYTEQARAAVYHWILHTSRLVLDKAHRELSVDIGASFQKLSRGTRKSMLNLVREGPDQKPGTSKFKNEWIMKELLKRTMKNERDGLKRPKGYAKQARQLLTAARAAGEDTPLLDGPIIRLDRNNVPLTNLYDEAHQTDDGEDEEDEDAERTFRRRDNAENEVLPERRKAQLEAEAREKRLLEEEDATWYGLEDEAQAALRVERQDDDTEEPEVEQDDIADASVTTGIAAQQ